MPWEMIVCRREELYEAVWSTPVRELAKQYGLSDVGIAKICRKLGVPLPGRGYWARKAAGQAMKKPRLPALRKDQKEEHRVQRWRDPIEEGEVGEEARALLEHEREAQPIVVPAELVDPHPFVARYAGVLRKAGKKRDTLFTERACLRINADGDALERALRIADALLKALDQRGFRIEVTTPEEQPVPGYHTRRETKPSVTQVHLLGSVVEFSISEAFESIAKELQRVEKRGSFTLQFPPYVEYEHRPTGRLSLTITNHYGHGARVRWSDAKTQRVEEFTNAFIVSVIKVAERKRLSRVEAERQEQEHLEAERRRKEELHRRQMEAELVYDLNSRVADWQQAQAIRAFVAQVEARHPQRQQGAAAAGSTEIDRWLEWTRRRAEDLERSAVETVLQHRQPPESRVPGRVW